MVCLYGGIPDFVKVLDFGLVKDLANLNAIPGERTAADEEDAELSQDGSLLGTPLYMLCKAFRIDSVSDAVDTAISRALNYRMAPPA